ncbi:MAG: ankyrin repeat domain-containing protein [Proteobacteria bacterium]|nr:ankyrin repeat domain-containing protein [Pseudomonadota bacterium]
MAHRLAALVAVVLVALVGLGACARTPEERLWNVLEDYVESYWDDAEEERFAERIHAAVGEGASPNLAYEGFVPLQVAIELEHTFLMRSLLARGADPNGDVRGRVLLNAALELEQQDFALWLLEAGADPNGRTGEVPPLAQAMAWERDAVAEQLLAAGADVNGRPDDNSPLVAAISAGSLDWAKRLLAVGADPGGSEADREGERTPLVVAAEEGHAEIFQELLTREASVTDPATLFLYGASAGSREILALLLERGVRPPDASFVPWALRFRHDELDERTAGFQVFAWLRSQGLRPTAAQYAERLVSAATDRDAETLRVLLQAGADPNLPNDEGELALHQVVRFDFIDPGSPASGIPERDRITADVTQALLRGGAEVDRVDDRGRTALIIAAQDGHPELVKLLLAAGADREHRDGEGKRALDYAVERHAGIKQPQDKMGKMAVAMFFGDLLERLRDRYARVIELLSD